ncbi:hypothetical protein SISNIDRAFT_455226 [Sistotremastrum niveocremeum HHB9708]|uniref:Uncharacterized protein n=1 Tax=Sistotremastrum niveocremeum HHB9708 TaxID=1314777 RepID=A0A164TUA0_9AGAM|nr:hypothetical protein SISNIDRAFT_455226 [Sistotremastrum niveocremeum HHB9708]
MTKSSLHDRLLANRRVLCIYRSSQASDKSSSSRGWSLNHLLEVGRPDDQPTPHAVAETGFLVSVPLDADASDLDRSAVKASTSPYPHKSDEPNSNSATERNTHLVRSSPLKRATGGALPDEVHGIQSLFRFLSDPNPSSLHSAEEIQAIYTTAASKQHLHHLSSKAFTSLISFFGSIFILSSNDQTHQHIPLHLHPLASRLHDSAVTPCWAFVKKIFLDKRRLKRKLTAEDNFWLALSYLSTYNPSNALWITTSPAWLNLARCIRSCLPNPPIAAYIMELILHWRDEEHVKFLLRVLGGVLESTADFPPEYQRLWLRMMFLLGPSRPLVRELIQILQSRSDNTDRPMRQTPATSVPSVTRSTRPAASVSEYHQNLTSALFNPPVYDAADPVALLLNRALQDGLGSPDTVWQTIVAIALPFTVDTPDWHATNYISTSPPNPPSTLLHFVCSMAAFERLVLVKPPVVRAPSHQQALQEHFQSLWKYFQSTSEPALTRLPTPMEMVIFLSFIRSVRSIPDGMTLFQSILSTLQRVRALHDAPLYPSVSLISTEIAITSVAHGARDWASIIYNLDLAGLSPTNSSMKEIGSRVVSFFTPTSPHLAHNLYLSTAACDFRLPTTSVAGLFRQCLRDGYIEKAIVCVADQSVPELEVWKWLDRLMMALTIPVERSVNLDRNAAELLGDALLRTVKCGIPEGREAVWQRGMLMTARNGNAGGIYRVVVEILRRWPDLLSHQFYATLIGILISQAKFTEALSLSMALPLSSERATIRLNAMERLALRGRSGPALQLWNSLSVSERRQASPTQRLLKAVRFNHRSISLVQSLRVVALVHRIPNLDIRTVNLALTMLISCRRPVAAHGLLKALIDAKKIQPDVVTMNILMGSPFALKGRRYRNARQVKFLVRLFREFLDTHTIIPDHISINILLKSVLRWKSVTSTQLRVLFDRCILGGYPSGRPPGSPLPLGSELSDSTPPLGGLGPPVSFEKNVRPLYRMFMAAFWVRGDRASARIVRRILANIERVGR